MFALVRAYEGRPRPKTVNYHGGVPRESVQSWAVVGLAQDDYPRPALRGTASELAGLLDQVDLLVNRVVRAGVAGPGPMVELEESLDRLDRLLADPPATTTVRSAPVQTVAVAVAAGHTSPRPFVTVGGAEVALTSLIRLLALSAVAVLIVLAIINW